MASLAKIENFINDSASSAYKDILESSESYNTRLCIERRLRMPFLDPQTGTAQNHCVLFKKRRQRMPGLREGQIYTYPAARWKKSRRQYLIQRPYRPPHTEIPDVDFSNHSSHVDNIPLALAAAVADMEGKDGHSGKDEINKEWYYDEMDLNDMDGYDDADPDSDFDYEEPYSIRKKGKRTKNSEGGSTRKQKAPASERSTGSETPAKKSGSRRGRKSKLNLDGDRSSSPMAYSSKKSRHSMQIHDDHSNSSFVANMDSPHPVATPHMPPHQQPLPSQMLTPRPELFGSPAADQTPIAPVSAIPSVAPPGAAGESSGGPPVAASAINEKDHSRRGEKGKLAAPSPYCDFCLGDTRENKKTGTAEELVSCSDCGRSGHPSCLQFTTNMMISVKRYRWQCIECKYCSICGTSDNDDQLLFCDDCDRGYHMYCLSPALTAPPEGSWSCKLCIEEFHTPKSANVPPPPAPPVSAAPVTSAITQQLQQPPVSGPPMGGGPPGHPPMPYGGMMHGGGGPGMHPGMPPQMGPHHHPPPPHGVPMHHGMPPQGPYGPPPPQPGPPPHGPGNLPPTTHANAPGSHP